MKRPVKRSILRTFVATLALAAVGAMSAPAQAAYSDEGSIVWRINNEHYKRRIHSLQSWGSLANVARNHSCEMARSESLFHTRNLGSKVRGWRILGENVAVGPDLYSIHKAWMASPSHRDNILETRYRAVGAGVCRSADGTYWVTTVFFG